MAGDSKHNGRRIREKWHVLRYLSEAKGRHGTHSPFVYSFIEQVIRGQIYRDVNQKEIRRSTVLAVGTLRFLKIKDVVLYRECSKELLTYLKKACPEAGWNIQTELKHMSASSGQLIFLRIEDYDPAFLLFLQKLSGLQGFGVFCFGIHRNSTAAAHWRQLCRLDNFQMTLDFWEAGLLLQDDAFKRKQHFVLKSR